MADDVMRNPKKVDQVRSLAEAIVDALGAYVAEQNRAAAVEIIVGVIGDGWNAHKAKQRKLAG